MIPLVRRISLLIEKTALSLILQILDPGTPNPQRQNLEVRFGSFSPCGLAARKMAAREAGPPPAVLAAFLGCAPSEARAPSSRLPARKPRAHLRQTAARGGGTQGRLAWTDAC